MPELVDLLDMRLPGLLFIVGVIFFAVGLGAETSIIRRVPPNRAHLFTGLGIVLALSGIGLHFSPVLSNSAHYQNGLGSLFSADTPEPSLEPSPTSSLEPTPTSSPTPSPPSPTPQPPSPMPQPHPISPSVCDQVTVISNPRYGTPGQITALSIRETPNRNAKKLGSAPVGAVVSVLCGDSVESDGRTWVYVRYSGVDGWMSDRYLSLGAPLPSTPIPAISADESCGSATVRSTPKSGDFLEIQVLAINSEPNRDSIYRIGQASVGSTLEVVCGRDMVQADGRTWVYVRYGGVEGWMSERFLDIN